MADGPLSNDQNGPLAAQQNSFLSPMCLKNEQIKQEPIGEYFLYFHLSAETIEKKALN